MLRTKKPLTTREVADYCHVSVVGVLNWIKAGKLRAYTTPGGHHRISKEDFRHFLTTHGMPIHEEFFAKETFKLLIVDNNERLVHVMRVELKTLDPEMEVEIALDGYDAGLKVASFRPDLVILDLVMPRVDGITVCRRLKADPVTRKTRVIAITGYNTDEKLRAIKEAGADACLVKPFQMSALCNEVIRLASGKIRKPDKTRSGQSH